MPNHRIWITIAIAASLAFAWWWFASDPRPQSSAPAVVTDRGAPGEVESERTADARAAAERKAVMGQASERGGSTPVQALGALLVRVVWEDDAPARDVGVAVVRRRPGRLDAQRVGVTDDRGEVRFEDLPIGTHALMAFGVGPVEVELAAATTTACELRLVRGFGIEGKVLDAFGAPVADAVLWLMPGGGQLDHRRALPVTRSHHDGTFRVDQMVFGLRSFLGARAAGYGPSAWRAVFARDEAEGATRLRGIELRLTGTIGTIAGRCVRDDGSPVAAATVHAVPLGVAWSSDDGERSWPGHEHWVSSDADGAFRCDDLAVGTWRLTACADHFWFDPVETTLATALGVQELELVGRPAATLVGVVRDPDGAPIEGAFVRVQGRHGARCPSGSDGSWTIPDLPAAKVEVRCWAGGYSEASPRELETVAGRVTQVDFELVPRPRLFGVARFASGESVAGWRLGALPADREDPSWVPSDVLAADGRFELFVDEHVPQVFHVAGPDCDFPIALREAGTYQPSGEAIELVISERAQADSWLVGVVRSGDEDLRGQLTLVRGNQRRLLGPEAIDASSGAFRLGPLPGGDYELLVTCRQMDGSRYGAQVVGRSQFGPFHVPRSQTIDVGELVQPAAASLVVSATIAPGCSPKAVRLEWRGRDEENTAGLLELDPAEPTTIAIVPGDYHFTVWGEGFLSVQRDVTVLAPPAPATRLEVNLRAGQRLPIRLELPEGEERAAFTIREAGSGRVAYEDEFGTDEARVVHRYPVLGLGRHLVECLGASGARYAGEFEVESLTPTREVLGVELGRR